MAKKRNIFGAFTGENERRNQAFFKRKRRAIDRKTNAEYEATLLSNQQKRQEIAENNRKNQTAALEVKLVGISNTIKLARDTQNRIRNAEDTKESRAETIQAHITETEALKQFAITNNFLQNLNARQALPEADLALKMARDFKGLSTKKHQRDMVTQEESANARAVLMAATDDDLKLRQKARSAGVEPEFFNTIMRSFNTLLGESNKLPVEAFLEKGFFGESTKFRKTDGEEETNTQPERKLGKPITNRPKPSAQISPEDAQRVLDFRTQNAGAAAIQDANDNLILKALNEARSTQVPK